MDSPYESPFTSETFKLWVVIFACVIFIVLTLYVFVKGTRLKMRSAWWAFLTLLTGPVGFLIFSIASLYRARALELASYDERPVDPATGKKLSILPEPDRYFRDVELDELIDKGMLKEARLYAEAMIKRAKELGDLQAEVNYLKYTDKINVISMKEPKQ